MARPRYYPFFFRYLGLLLFKRKTLGATVEEMARLRRADPFILFENQRISYSAFNRAANARANLFRTMGVAKGDVVALLMENRPEYLMAVTALAKLGAVTACINTNLTGAGLKHCLDISGAARLIVGRELVEPLTAVLSSLESIRPEGVFVDTGVPPATGWGTQAPPPPGAHDLDALAARAIQTDPPRPKLGSADLVLYIYTSGTTGMPKAARITHSRWYSAGLAMGFYALRLDPSDVLYCALPLYHSNGLLIAFGAAMVNGCTFAISRRFSASGFWEEVTRFQATSFIYIGEILRYLVHTAQGAFDRAHHVTRILGNGLRPDIWAAFQERFGVAHIREFYASTEGNAVTMNLDDRLGSVGKAALEKSSNLVLVRYDLERGDYVRNAEGLCLPCPAGEAGEMLGEVRLTSPFHGYSNQAETERKLLRNVFEKGDVYFKTGDLLKQDADGYYYFIDRLGDTFRWKGENVSTQEVQEVISAYPGLHMTNVLGVGVPHSEGRVGMAVLMLEPDAIFEPGSFYRFTQERLPAYARPVFVRLTPQMEVTGTFKMRKTELQKAGFDPTVVRDPLYFRDERQGSYVPLTEALFAELQNGSIRL